MALQFQSSIIFSLPWPPSSNLKARPRFLFPFSSPPPIPPRFSFSLKRSSASSPPPPARFQGSGIFFSPWTSSSSLKSRPRYSFSVKASSSLPPAVNKPQGFQKKAAEVADKLKGTSIFLVGMNGTMKTNLGNLLAEVLRYYYFNSDTLVEQAAGGESAAKLFREKDELEFRESETEVLKQLSSMGRLVVCAGDGAVQNSKNLALLRYGISVWIDVPLDVLAKEALDNRGPCPSTGDITVSDSFPEVLCRLTKLYEEMRGGYATADATVSLQKVACELEYEALESVTPEDMAMEALKQIERLTIAKKMMEEAARPF